MDVRTHSINLSIVLLPTTLPLLLFIVPLALGRVPRNRSYGYRTAASLSSDEAWYAANKIAGRAGVVVCAINLTTDILNLTGVLTFTIVVRLLILVGSYVLLYAYTQSRLRRAGLVR